MEREYLLKYISGDFCLASRVTVEMNGRLYTRVVKDNRECGLYIVINNRMYFEYECEY